MYYGVSADYILGRQVTDSITVVCDSPYTMDMANNLAELIEHIAKFDDKTLAAAAGYLKCIFGGIKDAVEEPNHPARPEDVARQQLLLADIYAALRETKE